MSIRRLLLPGTLMIAGCTGPPATDPAPAVVIRPPGSLPAIDRRELPVESARGAAAAVGRLGPISHAEQREILLHAALYRAAARASVGNQATFRLEPLPVAEWVSFRPREFRLRVLAELNDLLLPIAWARADDRPMGETVLAVRLAERSADGSTVTATIADRTEGAASSRRTVTARWIGGRWLVEPSGIRVLY